jgi:ABC-2 type transport system ATP-binding protein
VGTHSVAKDTAAPRTAAIRTVGLCKSYGRQPAVRELSFQVEQGELVGFLGPNGAGKSTTLRLLCGVLCPDAGRVEVAGHDLARAPRDARRAIGYLPEHTPLYRRMRVADYLDFVGRVSGLGRAERRAALRRVHGDCNLEGHFTRRIDDLSKGYRQRVGLAQALLKDPPVLVLDEPTSGLDPNEVGRLRELIAGLAGSKTVLLSTHVLSEIEEVCPRVLILAAGRLVADGPLERLDQGPPNLRLRLRADEAQARRLVGELGQLPLRSLRLLGPQLCELEWQAAEAEEWRPEVARRAVGLGLEVLELGLVGSDLQAVFRRATSHSGREAQ